MRKSVAALAALSMLPLIPAAQAAPPADKDACNALAFSLAEKAAGKKLPEAEALKADELIAKLEGQCADGKLAEAEGTAKEVEAVLK